MFGGGRGGFDPSQLQQMMEQLGIDITDIDATTVRIETADGDTLVFDNPEVNRMDAQGEETYQVIGKPEIVDADDGATEETAPTTDEQIPDEDVELVVSQTGASATDARAALESTDGDLAAAIERLD